MHSLYDDVTYAFYHKTVVSVNAPSARVTQGVPINNTLSLAGGSSDNEPSQPPSVYPGT